MLSAPEAAAENASSRPPSRGGDVVPAEGAGTAGGGEATPTAQPDNQPQLSTPQANHNRESEDDEEARSGAEDTPVIGRPRAAPERGFWGSRAPSPAGSEGSMPPPARPKSRAGAKYDSLNYWRAKRVTFYKNGDPYYQGLEFRFRPGRDVTSLEGLLDKLSLRLDLPRGARFIFSMDGERKEALDELEDGHSYVVSSYKTFKLKTGPKILQRFLISQNSSIQKRGSNKDIKKCTLVVT